LQGARQPCRLVVSRNNNGKIKARWCQSTLYDSRKN
jgi:hypothetical protein